MANLRTLPVGTAVAVYPGGGHLPESHWVGVIAEHHYWKDGSHLGLTDVRCTDPNGFMNNSVGLVTTVETNTLRVITAPDDGQLTLDLPA